MSRPNVEEIDPNNQYEEDEEQYEEEAFDNQVQDQEEEDDDGDEMVDGVDEQQHYSNGIGNNSVPNQAQENFDRVQMNSNFQFPNGYGQGRVPQQQLGPIAGAGRLRPQSAKTGDQNQLRFQQQVNQNQGSHPAWIPPQPQMTQPEHYSYQMENNNSLGPYPQGPAGLGMQGPYGQNFFYQNPNAQGRPMTGKKRPTTASRRNNIQMGGAKKTFASKNPSTLDLEVSRMRPRIINQDRERLYDDVMKNKISANFFKDDNMKLRTKVHILEGELSKKEKFIDDLIMQQDSYQVGGLGIGTKLGINKLKLESHLTMNLKKKIRDLQAEGQAKNEEIETLKRNIKNTKIIEIEVEMKMYMDECTRLRHQLEEVIKSKDTFADPEELKIIEEKFQSQDQVINNLKNENSELALAYNKKDEENRQLAQIIQDTEKRFKKVSASNKESAKFKKISKAQERELNKMKLETNNLRLQNDDYKTKIDELIKKQANIRSNVPSYTLNNSNHGGWHPHAHDQQSGDVKKLRLDLAEKEAKIKEINGVVSQLQQKLQEKINELSKEQAEKNKFKGKYEQYQDEVAKLQVQLEESAPPAKPKTQRPDDKKFNEKLKSQRPQSSVPQKKVPIVDPKQISDTCQELKLKLQGKAFYSNQMKDYFFKPYNPEGEVAIKELSDIFERNGFDEKQSMLLARYLVEPRDQPQIAFNKELTAPQYQIIDGLQEIVGQYQIYNDAHLVNKMTEKVIRALQSCKNTLKDTIELEDYEEEGFIPLSTLKEAFVTLDINLDKELMDYILHVVYQKSESISKMNYQVLFDLIEGKLTQGHLSAASDSQSRKRPESSSPDKIKARNQQKFQAVSQENNKNHGKGQKSQEENYDEEDEDNYEEEFEKLLDQDDEEEDAEVKAKNSTMKINQDPQEDEEDDDNPDGGEDDDYIDEEDMLDVAEKCFVRIAQSVIARDQTVRGAFQNFIIKEEIEGTTLELLSPIGFLEGIKELGITDLEEVEVACLMRVLTKPNLENAILLKELIVIMENFGIYDKEEGEDGDEAQEDQITEGQGEENDVESSRQQEEDATQQTEGKKKKKKGSAKPLDLSQLDEKSIKTLAKLMLALMELNVSLYDFFDGVIYEQLVKTKTKQNVVEIVNSKDFFEMLQARGVRKKANEHENLKKFLQLDANYPHLLMLKKIAKALDEMAKNEELMSGIMAAAEDDQDVNAGEGYVEDMDGQKIRLNTIGEDGEEDRHFETNKVPQKGVQSSKEQRQPQGESQMDDYDEDDQQFEQDQFPVQYEEKEEDDDYEF